MAEMAGTTFSAVAHLRMGRTGRPKGSRYSRWTATILTPPCWLTAMPHLWPSLSTAAPTSRGTPHVSGSWGRWKIQTLRHHKKTRDWAAANYEQGNSAMTSNRSWTAGNDWGLWGRIKECSRTGLVMFKESKRPQPCSLSLGSYTCLCPISHFQWFGQSCLLMQDGIHSPLQQNYSGAKPNSFG